MRKDPDKKVILEDGQEYLGWSFGADKEAILEIVFNTSMVGYQEILSDQRLSVLQPLRQREADNTGLCGKTGEGHRDYRPVQYPVHC